MLSESSDQSVTLATAPPRSLEHPLPAGMRDLLPEEATSRRAIARKVLDRFALHGYGLVSPPVFEFADVLERGLGTLDPADVLRFVEPESGEVAALRPDVTPQIARVIATRMRELPPPFRLCYEGSVLRRRSGRTHNHRQILQVGVELAGVSGPEGDIELITVAASALRAAGLERFTIDVGDAGIVRALLAGAPVSLAEGISDALSRKDGAEVAELARGTSLPYAQVLGELVGLNGGREALVEGARLLAATPAKGAAARLTELFDAAAAQGLAPHLTVDLCEVRGFAYYTGPVLHIFAPGPGGAIGSGGRYDDLLSRFGAPMPAVGFALDLDRLTAALRAAGIAPFSMQRVVVVGKSTDPRIIELRARGVAAVAMDDRQSAFAYARAWGMTHVFDSELVDISGVGVKGISE